MRKITLFLALGMCLSVMPGGGPVHAAHNVVLHLFWGEGCPHCEEEKAYLKDLAGEFPQLEVRMYEVWNNQENQRLFEEILEAYGITRQFVPMSFIGDLDPVVGFSKGGATAAEIKEKLRFCLENRCPDPVGEYLQGRAGLAGAGGPGRGVEGERPAFPGGETVAVPLLGELDAAAIALPVFTVAIAFLDSFNPCAFFVLTFLLSLLTHLGSSRRMLLIGGIFVTCSGLLYFLFMSAWFNLFFLTRNLRFITLAAGIVAVGLAVVNIKDFWWFQKGVSLSIPRRRRQVLTEKMRGLVLSRRLPAMIAGTVLLAAGANSYELLCTAGFPMVYTRVLTLRTMSLGAYYLYLGLYNLVYVLPLAAIVVLFAVTLGSRKMTEWQGRLLKLVSGLMMLALGSVLIIDPSLLNSLVHSVLLVGGTAALAALVAVAWRRFVGSRLPGGVRRGGRGAERRWRKRV